MKQGSRLSENVQLYYKDGAVHANRQDIAMIDIVNSTFHSIKRLFLSQNKIKHLHGMGQFKDLRILSLSYNYIEDFKELKYIPSSVDNLSLEGNPISNHPNYRLNVIEILPQLKTLDGKPIKDSERKDINDSNHLADYFPKLLFALDKLCTKTYKDILILGAQVEQFRKYNHGIHLQMHQNQNGDPTNEFPYFNAPLSPPMNNVDGNGNGEYKRCVKRIPPLSDAKDSRITIDGVRNLARNMFDETLIDSTLEECSNVAELELDRFRMELKEKIVKQYKEVKKYANSVACLEKEQRFTVYSGDQTLLYIFIKCMFQIANQLYEREIERERLVSYLKYCEGQHSATKPPPPQPQPQPQPVVREANNNKLLLTTPPTTIQNNQQQPQQFNNQQQQLKQPPQPTQLDKSKASATTTENMYSEKEQQTPRYQRHHDSSNGSIEDDDTVVISEDQLTTPDKDRTITSVITSPDSTLEENAFFLTKSTALHYKKWNKLFSTKGKVNNEECCGGGDSQESERRADEFRRQKLKSKVIESLKYYKEKKQEYRAQYEKKRKLKNIKARSFYVKSLQCKAFSALVQNMQRRHNFKRAIRILRSVRYELIMKKFFDSWRSLLLRCSDIRPLTAPPKYDSDMDVKNNNYNNTRKDSNSSSRKDQSNRAESYREDSTKNKYYRRTSSGSTTTTTRPQSAGNALTRQKEKENEAEQNGYKQQQRHHRYKDVFKEKVEIDGPVVTKKSDKKKRKTVVMLSVASNF